MHHSSYSEDPDSPDHTNTDFVACPLCMDLYVKKSSTATLQRHRCTKNTNQNPIEMYGKLTNNKCKILPTRVKDEAIENTRTEYSYRFVILIARCSNKSRIY